MARSLRIDFPGAIHNIAARGNEKATIFRDDADCLAFLGLVDETCRRYDWSCLSWCLMGNHYHLLVQTHQASLSKGMKRLNGSYARAFNDHHDRVGHVFQGRFVSRLVQDDHHLHGALRYVAANPVDAKLVADPAAWRWTSYHELIGAPRGDLPSLTAVGEVLSLFSDDHERAVARYVELIASHPSIEPLTRQRVTLGDPTFESAVLPSTSPGPDILRAHWAPGRPSLESLLRDGRDASLARAWREHAYRQCEIAAELGCHVSTVSRRIAAFEAQSIACT